MPGTAKATPQQFPWWKSIPVNLRKYGVILGLVFASFSGPCQSGEVRLLKNINGTPHVGWDNAMRNLSFSVYLLEPVPPVAISLHGYFKKDKEMLWNGYKSAISLCAALAISTGIKYTADRMRPYNAYPGYIDGRDQPHTPSTNRRRLLNLL